jgi:hypothetical protein
MIKFYTKAWLDEIARRLESDPRFAQDGKKLNGTFVFRIYDGPDGKDRRTQWTFKQGKALDYRYESHPSPWEELRKEPFSANFVMRSSAPFTMAAKLNRGEISAARALTSPEYQVEGNKSMIMMMMKSINVWNEVATAIEVAYDFTDDGPETAEATSAQV